MERQGDAPADATALGEGSREGSPSPCFIRSGYMSIHPKMGNEEFHASNSKTVNLRWQLKVVDVWANRYLALANTSGFRDKHTRRLIKAISRGDPTKIAELKVIYLENGGRKC